MASQTMLAGMKFSINGTPNSHGLRNIKLTGKDLSLQTAFSSFSEIVRAFTHVINQGQALYWGTSRWSPMEIMVQFKDLCTFYS